MNTLRVFSFFLLFAMNISSANAETGNEYIQKCVLNKNSSCEAYVIGLVESAVFTLEDYADMIEETNKGKNISLPRICRPKGMTPKGYVAIIDGFILKNDRFNILGMPYIVFSALNDSFKCVR